MAMETAAAILTKLAFEQNTDLKSRLSAVQGKEKELVALMMPLFRQILSEMERDRQSHDKFPSAVPDRSPRRLDNRPQPNLGGAKKAHDEEHHDEQDDIGGEG
jgi:hypothetical protein